LVGIGPFKEQIELAECVKRWWAAYRSSTCELYVWWIHCMGSWHLETSFLILIYWMGGGLD